MTAPIIIAAELAPASALLSAGKEVARRISNIDTSQKSMA
jgi:hypothetical protein